MIENWAPTVTSATKPRYTVVVPVFNEGENIGAFCAAAREHLPPNFELLICYDFDEDNTLPALEKLPPDAKPANIRLVRNRLGRGARWAIDAGMRAADADIVLVTMADLSDDFSNVEPMLKIAEAGADVVCASRYMPGGQQIGGPKFKKFLSRTAGLTLKWFAGLPTYDPTNSFKVYRREFLRKTPIETDAGFALGLELTVKAHLAGRRVEEVPATWQDRTAGTSRFQLLKWIPLYLRWYLLAMRRSTAGKAVWFAFLTLAFIFMLAMFLPPANGPLPDGDLDSSWCLVLHWTHAHHVDFGRDIVFTFGPWGYIIQGFTPGTYASLAAAWTLIAAASFAGAVKISRQLGNSDVVRWIWLIIITALAGIEIDQLRDVRLFAPTCIFFLLYAFLDDLDLNVTTVLLMAATALTGQVKFSTTLMTLAALGIISIDQVRRRKRPWALGIYVLCYLVLWMVAGQSLGALPAYFSTSMAVAGGYAQGEGLSMPTETSDVTWFILCALPMLATAVYAALRGGKGAIWQRLAAPIAGLAFLMFVIFKAGYVRHDQHAMEGTASLAFLALLVMAAVWRRLEHPAWKTMAVLGVLGPLILTWQSFARYDKGTLPGEMAWTLRQAPRRVGTALNWIDGKKDFANEYLAKLDSIRQKFPIPPVNGTVDIYPWYQNQAIAYGLNYQPRPVFQSYLAYTPALEQLNADSLDGPRAPDSILWAFGCIDGDYPSLEDGLTWPRILTHYDLKSADTSMLLFTRSAEPRNFSLVPLGDPAQGQMGRSLTVPSSDDPIWTRITVRPTLLGRVASALDKPPVLLLTVHTAGGENTFRLLTENASAGFLLSPVITEPLSFAVLQSPDWAVRLAAQKVTSLTVAAQGSDGKTAYYQDQFDVSFESLIYPHRDISSVPGMPGYLNFQDFLRAIVDAKSEGKVQLLPLMDGRKILFAPARTILATRVPPGSTRVHLRFGILNQAYLGLPQGQPHTDGVEFRLYVPQVDAAGRTVGQLAWSRGLDPDHQPGDRGIQEADVILGMPPPPLILLDTEPGPKHINSFSFWAGAEFHP